MKFCYFIAQSQNTINCYRVLMYVCSLSLPLTLKHPAMSSPSRSILDASAQPTSLLHRPSSFSSNLFSSCSRRRYAIRTGMSVATVLSLLKYSNYPNDVLPNTACQQYDIQWIQWTMVSGHVPSHTSTFPFQC